MSSIFETTLPRHSFAAGRPKQLSHGLQGPDSFSEGAAGKNKTSPTPLFWAGYFAFLPSKEESEPASTRRPRARTPSRFPVKETQPSSLIQELLAVTAASAQAGLKKKRKEKKGKERKPLLASEITRKVTFLMLTHTKRAQPLI